MQMDNMIAQANLCELTFALKQYKADQGQFPDALNGLMPKYIPALPEDPFSGQPYCYRKEGDEFVLYSVGENRNDDGGMKTEQDGKDDIVWRVAR